MWLSVYQGRKYSYSYECGTGNYLLYDNEYRRAACLRGGNAAYFSGEVDRINLLPENNPVKPALLIENMIRDYL
jgi:hypothetical protein